MDYFAAFLRRPVRFHPSRPLLPLRRTERSSFLVPVLGGKFPSPRVDSSVDGPAVCTLQCFDGSIEFLPLLDQERDDILGWHSGAVRRIIAEMKKARGMAERGRFELPEPVKVQRFSRPPQSTTLPPLRDDSF
jgi:hypothetical protein